MYDKFVMKDTCISLIFNEIFIDDKFTQDTLDTLKNDIFDVTLYNVPVAVMSVQFIFVDVVLLLYTLF